MSIIRISSGTVTVGIHIPINTDYIVADTGTLDVVNGGTVSGLITISSGGAVNVRSGGMVRDTTVSSGGDETVSSGGDILNTRVSDGGAQYVSSGGTVSGTTVMGGGTQYVFSGGAVTGTTVNNGEQEVSSGGQAIGTALSGGDENVFSGGLAIGTVVGEDSVQNLDGGTASNTIVDSGSDQVVNLGGKAIGTTVNSGGFQDVFATVVNPTINGGQVNLQAGAVVSGAITFAPDSEGTLQIAGTRMPTAVISGFAPGDTIDLSGVSFASGGAIGSTSGNLLQVVENGNTYDLQLDPLRNFSGDSFRLSSDGGGGTDVTLKQGLSINVTYDSSVTTASNAAAIEGAVAAAVQFLENTFTNPITLNIDVGFGEVNGSPISASALAESKSNNISTSYAAITSAFSAGAISADQIAAAANLPASNPTSGGSFVIARAEAKALGLLAGTDNSIVDGYVGLSSANSFTFDPNNRAVSGEYDAIGVLEHEITEVMGRVGSLGQHDGTNVYTPIDLFRYASPGVRQLVYGPGYFSVNGQTLLTPYNNPSSGGDAVDWDPLLVGDSFGDGYTGVASLVGATDIEEMNVLGYDVAFAGTVGSGQTLTVSAGQSDTSLIVLSGGTLNVLSGGIVINTLDSGGIVNVSSGAAASGTAIFSGGSQNVFSGGTATTTAIDNGGVQLVAGGVASTTAINIGGTMVLSSGATHASLVDGAFVFGGSPHSLTGIVGSGAVIVSAGTLSLGLASGCVFAGEFVIAGGGTLEVTSAGAAAGRPIDFADAGAILRIDGTTMPNDVISGFSPNEAIDLSGVSFDSSGSATQLSGNVLQVVENSQTYDLNLDPAQSFTGQRFLFSADGGSGTDIAVTSPVVSSGQVLSVSSGQTGDGIVVLGGGTLDVLSGATESGATVSSGGALDVFDGGTLAGNVANDGTVNYDITGSASFSGTLTGAGTLVVSGGGVLDVVSAYTGLAQIDDNSTLEFTSTFMGAATFSGSSTGPGGKLKLDAGSTGPITVVNSNDTVIAQPGSDNWINAAVSYTLPANIDALFLYAGSQGTGNSDASGDALYALDAGNAQTLTGNSPNDTFVVYNSSDAVVPKAGSHDVVYAAASYTLPTGVDALILEGTAAQGVGNSDAAGDGLYAANPGQVATLTGNSPNDTFVVYNSADLVVPKAGSHDVVYSAVNYTLPAGVDIVILEGTATQGVGNSDASGDALYAANPGQVVTLTGNSANDTFVVYNSADVVASKAGSHDVVYSAVNYTLPTGVDSLILEAATQAVGNSDASGDTLYAANAGIAQTLTGNSHYDTFVVYNAGDTVIGQASSTDTVYAAASFTLPTNVDTLFLEGSASHGTGNSDAGNALYGNAGIASTLVAGSGADTLYVNGNAGTILTGGAGHDTFAFPNVMGHDEVTNFGVAKDTLQFNATLFSNFAAAMNAASQVGANTVFTIDANDTVTLDNVTKSSLTAGNFHFS
jgi:autotransporter passenger strand-loop-strand repeat protein